VEKMGHGYDPIPKKFPQKTLIKRYPEDHFEDLMKGEFFNFVLKKNLLFSHECTTKKLLFPLMSG
jgi:hypothetical protein